MSRKQNSLIPIQSTAGAIPVKNEKGQVSMQKVKVNRYISGKRPDYAQRISSGESSDDEDFIVPNRIKKVEEDDSFPVNVKAEISEAEKTDPRLRRLRQTGQSASRRRIEEPEVLGESGSEEERPGRQIDSSSESEAEEEDDKAIERRRTILRQRALEKLEEDEILAKEEEKDSAASEEESESEYEEYTDSEDEAVPRLKPVFVRKSQRVTIKTDVVEEIATSNKNTNRKRDEKRLETLKLIESEIRRDKTGKEDEESMATLPQLTDVNTDDENEDAEFEAWKLRELKRTKRDRDEREAIEKEKLEIQRIHSLTEEERRAELKQRPKLVINKATKGKYKFLQKYYHRGAFYLDKEQDVLKRDNSLPTLEDHFDKTILPKVMQVKNFGRSGRTKYTHLVDQDTTTYESPWTVDSTQNLKFYATHAAGTRQVFEKPSTRKRHLEPPPSQT